MTVIADCPSCLDVHAEHEVTGTLIQQQAGTIVMATVGYDVTCMECLHEWRMEFGRE